MRRSIPLDIYTTSSNGVLFCWLKCRRVLQHIPKNFLPNNKLFQSKEPGDRASIESVRGSEKLNTGRRHDFHNWTSLGRRSTTQECPKRKTLRFEKTPIMIFDISI